MKYYHVDVFASKPLSGNGLTVVFPGKPLEDSLMLAIAQEFKQFETIFIYPESSGAYPVRIFTVEEELDFAGHPMLGAAAVIHELSYSEAPDKEIVLDAGGRKIQMMSSRSAGGFNVVMNQGSAEFQHSFIPDDVADVIAASNLKPEDLSPGYPIEIVSTGLPYLLLPVKDALERIQINREGFEELLTGIGAKFAYYFNPETLECRTWDNAGLAEDAATGSAAGPLCAYLVENGIKPADEDIEIKQGRFIGRPCSITGRVVSSTNEIFIRGGVAFFAEGDLRI